MPFTSAGGDDGNGDGNGEDCGTGGIFASSLNKN
jgi:hypothetical protein